MKYAPSKRFGEYVRKLMACGHWEDAERADGDHVAWVRHKATGKELNYQLHDGGNDTNSPRNMARAAQDICGCKFIEVRGRKRSRKAVRMYDAPKRSAKAEAKRLAEFNARREREALQRAVDKRNQDLNSIRRLMGG